MLDGESKPPPLTTFPPMHRQDAFIENAIEEWKKTEIAFLSIRSTIWQQFSNASVFARSKKQGSLSG